MSDTKEFSQQKVKLLLCDPAEDVRSAWTAQFAEKHPEVQICADDLLASGADAIVCPGNAFGFMDGGLALRVLEELGWELQDRLRAEIDNSHEGELLVGQAVLLDTGKSPRWIVYVPIARTSLVDDSLTAYLAARAVFRLLRQNSISEIAFPGLATGDRGLASPISARQLRYAYEEAAGLRKVKATNLSRLQRREKKLRSLPRSSQN